jgi:hypothetical protein
MAGLQVERIGDVDEGEPPVPSEVDEFGLTPDERAAFDGMKDADKGLPEAPEEPEEAPAPAPAPEEPKQKLDAPPAPPKKVEAPEEDDEPDQVTRDPRTGKEQRTISYGKHQRLLKKAREDAEALRAQAEEGRINHAKLTERLAILNDALTAPPPPPQLTPQEQEQQRRQEALQNPMLEDTIDPSIDLAGSIAQMQRRQIFMAQANMYQQEATQEQLADQQMVRDFTRDAEMFSRSEEGQHFFGDAGAYQFLKNSRLCELAYRMFRKDPTNVNDKFTQKEINQLVSSYNEEERDLVGDALQNGVSPSQTIMWYAKGRGWRPPQPAAPPPAPPPAPASARKSPLAPPAAVPPPQPSNSAVARIQSETAGAAASRSLSDGGGVPPAEPLSIEQLLKMDDEEFGVYIDNLPPQRLQSLMGRDFPTRH